MASDFVSGIVDLGEGIGNMIGGAKQRKHAREERKRLEANQRKYEKEMKAQRERENKLNWTPHYASDYVDPYRKTQSKQATTFLSSLMSGDNPLAADTPWSPGAAQAAAGRSDQKYGTLAEALLKDNRNREDSYDMSNPGKIKNPK